MEPSINSIYNVIFRQEPEGGFTVVVPSLPGCVTYGKDLASAKLMVKDAISLYLQSLQKHGDRIPSDNDSFFSTIDLNSTPVYA